MKENDMPKYRLNVDPDREHDLTDAEVRDLRVMGFTVTAVGGRKLAASPEGAPAKPAAEKKEG